MTFDSLSVARTSAGPVIRAGGGLMLCTKPEFAGAAGFLRLLLRPREELFAVLLEAHKVGKAISNPKLLNPIEPAKTPILGAGVTFSNSLRERRLETFRAGSLAEVTDDGRPTPYDVVYDPANPPEVFFKAIQKEHLSKPNELWIRPDGAPDGQIGSSVPEPERVLIVNHVGEIVAETIGSDTTARQLESRSALYLPAAKTYPGCTTLCPWLTVFAPLAKREAVTISMQIRRNGETLYDDQYSSDQMKRTPESLVEHARTITSSERGFALFTGTGIIPPIEFSLAEGDVVTISSPQLGLVEASTRIVRY